MTLYHSTGIIAASGGAAAKPGMVLLKPTSVDKTGTSASIGANGQVTFTAVTSLSLNGVFSATYDNYVISVRHSVASGSPSVLLRMRVSGTDATGSNYAHQELYATSTSVASLRVSSQTSVQLFVSTATARSGDQIAIYGPALAQPTAFRNVSVLGVSSAAILDTAGTHSLSTAYDGFTLTVSTAMTGALQVYGVRS